MSRYYKTARPQNIDYAFRLPTNLLAKVVQSKDAAIDRTYGELEKMELSLAKQKDSTSKIGQGMYLSPDEEANMERMKYHEDRISEIGEKLRSDPFSYGTLQGDISDARGDIRSDFLYGGLAKQHENYAYVKQWTKDMDKDGIDREYQNRVLQQEMTRKDGWGNTNYDPETGGYSDIEDYLPKSLFNETFQDMADEYGKQVKNRTNPIGIQKNIASSMMADDDVYAIYKEQLKYGDVPEKYQIQEDDSLKEKGNKMWAFAMKEAGPVANRYYKPEKEVEGSKKADYSEFPVNRKLTIGGAETTVTGAWPKEYTKAQQNSIKDKITPKVLDKAEIYFEPGTNPFGEDENGNPITTIEAAVKIGNISLNPKDDKNIPNLKYSNLDEYDIEAVNIYSKAILNGASEKEAMSSVDELDRETVEKWVLVNPLFSKENFYLDEDKIKKEKGNYFKIDRNTIEPGYDENSQETVFSFTGTIGGEPFTMGVNSNKVVNIKDFSSKITDPNLGVGTPAGNLLDNADTRKEVTDKFSTGDNTGVEIVPNVWLFKDEKGFYYGQALVSTRGVLGNEIDRTKAIYRINKQKK